MNNHHVAPLSALQRGMWFLDQWDPGAATYTVPWVFEIHGPLDPGLLARALNAVIARHGALRTTFAPSAEGPRQIVHPELTIALARTDLSALPAGERPAALDAHVEAEVRQGFDLETGPLLRARLLTCSPERSTLVLTVHHLVWDGWSAGVFERELAELYTALEEGRVPVLPELTLHYAEHAAAPLPEDHQEQLDRWTELLRGAPDRLPLPAADRPRPRLRTREGDTAEFGLPPGLAARVRALAAASDATPFMVLLSAFAVLLNRCTGARDLVVGTPVTTRNQPELEDLIGYFVTILPLRIRVDRAGCFRELLAQVRDTAFEAYAGLDVSFDAIVDALGLERSTECAPLVQAVFGVHGEDTEPLRLGRAEATRRVHRNGTAKYDLTWSVFDSGELRGEVEYSSDVYDAPTVRRLTGHWASLLTAALDDPDGPLWRLDPFAEHPATRAEPAPGRCLHELFEAAADRHPERPALTFGELTLSYAELDRRANRLAHALAAAGVRPGDRVGLLLDRTEQTVLAVLAVLKAGAVYVPVDLAAPGGRAALVFEDTGVRVVLTDQGERAPRGDWTVLDPARLDPELPATRPTVPVRPGDLAYLIFTSGSTGRPKGVAVAHEHVSRLMDSGDEHFAFTEDAVWTLFHSYAFDWTVWELWGALHHGARLVVVPYLLSRSPQDFAALLEAEGVTHLCQTPSALRQLEAVLRQEPRALPELRQIMLGGEALDPAVVRRWSELDPKPPARLCNLYGITETTVHVTTHDLADTPGSFPRSFIGEPMPHLHAAVLDPWLQPCPVGVPGELYVSGGSLAHGYWGRPGLTAERFLPDPTGTVPGGRRYRTGDLARRLPGGGLEYLGRCDDQVKVRGFRIELGEIENALTLHPAITGSAVTVYEPRPQDRRLAAYVTASGPAPGYPDLRAFLARSLPEYMIPATVTVLEALPLTVNGKVDRAALPEPEAGPVSRGADQRAPETAGEKLIAEIWAEVLDLTEIGAHDNFFHLGGDSIRAVTLTGRLRQHGWTLSLQDLFASPTPAALAPLLKPVEAAERQPRSGPFALTRPEDRAKLPDSVVDAYPMVSMQLSMVYHMELSGDAGGYHNVNSYLVGGRLDERALRTAVAQLADRHPVLRTSLDVSSYSLPLQLVHAEVPPPVDVTDLRKLTSVERAEAVAAAFEEHCDHRFDLRHPPLFRVAAQRLTDDSFQLTLAEHHAILDGWSFTSLLTELLERHAALAEDPLSPPVPPPVSTFRDFVAAEREADEAADAEEFWRTRLAGVSGALWGSSAHAEPEIPRTVELVLPEAPTRLREAAERAGTPVKAVALAAHLLALHAVTGLSAPTTGLSVNGRLEDGDGAAAYGLFLNTVPFAIELAGSNRELVQAVHRAETALLPHRRTPFARLARLMADTRLDANFAFLRFHSLGRLAGPAARIMDDRIGCEPTMRYEPTNFALGAAIVQDPSSGRTLLALDHARSLVPEPLAERYLTAYVESLAGLADRPDQPCR